MLARKTPAKMNWREDDAHHLSVASYCSNHCYLHHDLFSAWQCPGRESDSEVTFFKSVGNAAQDIVCAAAVLQQAKQNNLGRTVEL